MLKEPYDSETMGEILAALGVALQASAEVNHPLGHFVAGMLNTMFTAMTTGTTRELAAEMCVVCDKMMRLEMEETSSAYIN